MALERISGGYYDAAVHGYYSEDGVFVPSATQVLSLCGLSDYSMVPPDTLERKRRIGTEVHDHCASIDRYGDIDPSWVSDEARGYVDAYLKFRREKNFVPDVEWIERPAITTIHGMKIGATPDCCGTLDGYAAVLERKCVAAPQSSWAVQTGIQEFVRYQTSRLGRTQRFALQLMEDGRYKLDPHMEHSRDEFKAISALAVVYMRIDDGHKVWERV